MSTAIYKEEQSIKNKQTKSRIATAPVQDDSFDNNYRQCIKGKTLNMDENLVIYNNAYFQPIIFKRTSSVFMTNEQQLGPIRDQLDQL